MWRTTIDRSAAIFWVIFLTLFLALLALTYPVGAHQVYIRVYLTCAVSIVAMVVMLMAYRRKYGFDLFDPIYFISLVYGLLFFVTPAYDIAIGNYLWFGYDVFGTGVRATIYALLGFAAFAAAYSFGFHRSDAAKPIREPIARQEEMGRAHVAVIMLMFAFCFVANMYYLTRNGSSWLYVLTLGVFDAGDLSDRIEADIGFLAMFSYCLPAIVLLYWEYGKSKALKWVLFYLMLVMQVARGFRFFVVQIFMTFLTFAYLRKKQRPGVGTLVGIVAIATIPIMLMTLFRNNFRAGSAVDYAPVFSISLRKAVDEVFWFNFRIYHNFFALIAKVPSRYGYVYGRQIIVGTAIMLIPRLIWPGKLSSGAGEPIWVTVGSRLRGTGQALPNLGEFYYALGIAGILICMAIYGLWMRHVKRRYLDGNSRPMDLIQFSILLGTNLQIIIRGYTPSNFWYVIFSVLPVWIFSFVTSSGAEGVRRRAASRESEEIGNAGETEL